MHCLGDLRLQLKQVSSVALARTREPLHNSWGKSDLKEAQVILHMLEIGAVQVIHDPMVATQLVEPSHSRLFSVQPEQILSVRVL